MAMEVPAQGHHSLAAAVELLGPLGRDRLHENHDSLPSTPCQGAAGARARWHAEGQKLIATCAPSTNAFPTERTPPGRMTYWTSGMIESPPVSANW